MKRCPKCGGEFPATAEYFCRDKRLATDVEHMDPLSRGGLAHALQRRPGLRLLQLLEGRSDRAGVARHCLTGGALAAS